MDLITAIETGCPYVLTIGNQIATFNVPADPNFVGYINDVTGLDMYGIRENATVVSSADGGYHGAFWRDRRPFTLAGFIMPTTPVAARDAAQDKILGVIGQALRADAILNWTPADNIQKGIKFRAQQPVRYAKGQSNVEKMFTIAGVCADWRILTWAAKGVSGGNIVVATNGGNADAAPKFTITGPSTNPSIMNNTTGKAFTLNTTVNGTAVIDLTGVYPTVTSGGGNWYQYIDPLNTDWSIAVAPGANTFTLNGGGSLRVDWNDSWH